MKPDEERPILVNVEAAAHLLGISRSEAYALAASGQLPTVRFGRAVRVHRGELERWAKEQARFTWAEGPRCTLCGALLQDAEEPSGAA